MKKSKKRIASVLDIEVIDPQQITTQQETTSEEKATSNNLEFFPFVFNSLSLKITKAIAFIKEFELPRGAYKACQNLR